MSKLRYRPKQYAVVEGVPFDSAEEAWLWYARCQLARLAGGRPNGDVNDKERGCDPDDIYREVMKLHRKGVLKTGHLQVLAELGCRLAGGAATGIWSEGQEIIWREALDHLEIPLRNKGLLL